MSGATALSGGVFYNTPKLRLSPHRRDAMTSEQAAQLIDNTLDQVHQRLQDLESQSSTTNTGPWPPNSVNGANPSRDIST